MNPERAAGRMAFAFVLLVWLGLLIRAHVFIAAHAARFPIGDDVAVFGLAPPLGDFSWGSLWALHNEHRVPLPRLLLHALAEGTGDLRSVMYLELELLGGVALAMILCARKLRGRASFADAFFPLVWLHVGNAENLLASWQLVETLPVALVSALMLVAVSSARPLLGGGFALLFPLCGGVGILQLPAWFAWLVFRRASLVLLGLLALVCVAYFVGFEHPHHVYTGSLAEVLPAAGALLALALGPAAESWWPFSCALVVLALGASVWLLAPRIRDPRAAGLLASIAGTLCLVLVIAVARGNTGWRAGFADRYVSLTAPLLCSAYFAWTLFGQSRARAIACAALALACAAAWPLNEAHGRAYGERRRAAAAEFEALAAERAPVGRILAHYSRTFSVAPEIGRVLLRRFAAEGRPPFDAGRAPSAAAFEYPALRAFPARIESGSPSRNTLAEEDAVLLVEAPLAIRLPLRGGERTIRGRFGIPELLIAPRRSRKLRFTIVLPDEGFQSLQLLERVLDSNQVEADRTLQAFELELPAYRASEVVLRAEIVDPAETGLGWTAWSAVELR